jgi:hypothetical protein
MHKKVRDYSKIKLDLPVKIEPGGRKIIHDRMDIDYKVFQKNPEEKQRLKDAKAGIVTLAPVPKKKSRGGWEWRMRKRLKIEGLSHEEIEKRIFSHKRGKVIS